MAAPGEALLIKLWDTLADKGVGGLLRPWQIGREARAHTDARRIDMLSLANAEREVQEIRSGRKTIAQASYALSLPFNDSVEKVRIDPSFEFEVGVVRPSIEYSVASSVADSVRREVNIAKAIIQAEEELKDDPTVTSDAEIEKDWLFRWRDYAGDVSSEKLQLLWGRLLAGELKAPGKYSYRTLEFLRSLTVQEAKDIEAVFPFVFTDVIVSLEPILKASGFKFSRLLALQEIGILQGVDSPLSRTYVSIQPDQFRSVLLSGSRTLEVSDPDPNKTYNLTCYFLTGVGRELFSLGKFLHDEGFMRAVGLLIKGQGLQVRIGNLDERGGEAL
jgi:hypothetical protein